MEKRQLSRGPCWADVKCKACDALLYKYRKGGKGSLVKCYLERITEDMTTTPCECPGCGQTFARVDLVHGKPAHKIIGGKAYQR
jgi:ribosomal protein S27E